ncbi:MAG: hypothetical protein ACYC5N_02020 [Endomicrobiales bacterium]
MIKKLWLHFLVLPLVIGGPLSRLYGVSEEENTFLIIVADYGKKSPSREVVSAISAGAGLKLVLPWPSSQKPPDEIKSLIGAKRVELALTLQDEPVLPLLYSAKVPGPLVVEYSWPRDIDEIVVRSQVDARQNMIFPPERGIYLRSGMLSREVIGNLKKLGFRWANFREPRHLSGAFFADNFLLLSPKPAELFANAQECWDWVKSRREPVVVLSFDDTSPLSPAFLSTLAGFLKQDPGVKMVTPEQLWRELKQRPGLARPDPDLAPDLSAWLQAPIVWYQLDGVRRAIEEYKNSGQAQLKVLARLNDELYHLYRYDLLWRLAQAPGPEDEKTFDAGVAGIYRILNPPAGAGDAGGEQADEEGRPFNVESTLSSLVMFNSSSAVPDALAGFSVSLTTDTVSYSVFLSTGALPAALDVYMDLNNQEGAGLTRLLPGVEAFMEIRDAWEFALRFEKDQVSLYRSGRFEPTLMRTFKTTRPFEAELPRALLRGNPLQWGYQVVALDRKGDSPAMVINDFLSQDHTQRRKILGDAPVQLPAVRPGAHARLPGE